MTPCLRLALVALVSAAGCFDFAADRARCRDVGNCSLPVDAGPLDGGWRCVASGWCWENPWPQGNWLNGIYGFGSNDIWAVGERGTTLHWDGTSWTGFPGTTVQRSAVWGARSNDVWAIGGDGVFTHWDGARWTETKLAGGGYTAFAPRASEDIWAVGFYGDFAHFDGRKWTVGQSPPSQNLNAAIPWGASGFVAVGNAGNAESLIDGGWVTLASGGPPLAALWRTDAGSLWAAGGTEVNGAILRFDGGTFAPSVTTSDLITALWGPADDDLWAVGARGAIYRFDGSSWSKVSAVPEPNRGLAAVWGASAADVWAVGTSGEMLHYDGSSWRRYTQGPTCKFNALWVFGETDLWGVGDQCAYHRGVDGAWSQNFDDGRNLNAVLGLTDGGLWVVGDNGKVYWRNGSSLSPAPSSPNAASLQAITAAGDGTIWAAGASGTVASFTGSAWTKIDVPVSASVTFRGAATIGGELWFVGTSGTVLHGVDAGWELVSVATAEDLSEVWGLTPSDVWVGGGHGTLRHFNGSIWVDASLVGVGTDVTALWGAAADDVWATAGFGFFHWGTGPNWDPVELPSQAEMFSITGGPTGVWAAGNQGNIVRLRR